MNFCLFESVVASVGTSGYSLIDTAGMPITGAGRRGVDDSLEFGTLSRICEASEHDERPWRNWQTRQVEGLVGVNPVEVQILSAALV